MTREFNTHPEKAGPDSSPSGREHWPLLRWLASSAFLNVPQAASPIAFSLLALHLTGETNGGAAMILAMTLAQVAGVIPITRLGARFAAAGFLRGLIAARSLALIFIALGAWREAPLGGLIFFAALAGLVNGAAYGYLRVILNHLVTAARLPRALGIAATLNEVTFVLAPVAASGFGIISPVFSMVVITALSALPAFLVPDTGSQHIPNQGNIKGKTLSPAVMVWLVCAAGGGSAVAGIEIGAVALALHFNHEPAFAVLFTVPLCLASVTGGIWVSVRNRMATQRTVLMQLSAMTLGSVLAALEISLALTVLGAVLIGSVLAPLATHYSLALDKLAPPQKKAEVFALLRTANALGVIFTSALLTATSLSTALVAVTCLMAVATVSVGIATFHSLKKP